MQLYRVILHGENFPGAILGTSAPVGFYTTRFVEAVSESEAEEAALAVLRDDPALQVRNEHRTGSARVLVDSLVRVESETLRVPNAGFTFYPMGGKSHEN